MNLYDPTIRSITRNAMLELEGALEEGVAFCIEGGDYFVNAACALKAALFIIQAHRRALEEMPAQGRPTGGASA